MSTIAAADLAWELERAQRIGLDVLTEGVVYDPGSAARVPGTPFRPMTQHELKIAQRYVRRAEKQAEYAARRELARQRKQAALHRAERAAHDENRLRTARVAIANIASASKVQ